MSNVNFYVRQLVIPGKFYLLCHATYIRETTYWNYSLILNTVYFRCTFGYNDHFCWDRIHTYYYI